MQPSIATANFFLDCAFQIHYPMDSQKLVALTYIAHGWHLGITGRPLLSESIEAWQAGPVVPSVYHQFASNAQSITSYATNYAEGDFFAPKIKNVDIQNVLSRVWKVYQEIDTNQLVDMCKKRGTPWHTTWVNRKPSDCIAIIIPNNTILSYYKLRVDKALIH